VIALTAREEALLSILREAVASGRSGPIDETERRDRKRFRRRLLYALRYHGRRRGGHPTAEFRSEGA